MRIRINKTNREDKKECVSYDDGIVSAWYGSMVQSKYGMVWYGMVWYGTDPH